MNIKVIAEAGQGKGDFGYLADAIGAAARAGCWGVKIQLLRPDRIARADAGVYWDERRPEIKSQRDTFAAVGCLDYALVADLVDVADDAGIELVATPFDFDAVEAMAKAGLRHCKIASGDITHKPLIGIAAQAFPCGIILSTGAATLPEIDRAISWVYAAGYDGPAAVLACSLAYPTPADHAEIRRVTTLRQALSAPVGYSDHTHGTAAARVAVAAGATMLEKHFTLDPTDLSVPDNAFALNPDNLAIYVWEATAAAGMLGTGDLGATDIEQAARVGARRSICAARDIPAGHVIGPSDVDFLRPADPDGLAPFESVMCEVALRPIAAGTVLRRDDFE
jgi:N,N'-diacetyllegionaminate synthase